MYMPSLDPQRARADSSSKQAWTNPLRFKQVVDGRNQTLGMQRELYSSVLRTQLKAGMRIVETCAGTGWLQEHIVPHDLKAGWIEVDFNEYAQRQSTAIQKRSLNVFSLASTDGFEAQSVDAIVDCSGLDLIHPIKHRDLLTVFHKVLKPGGKLISFQDAPPNHKFEGFKGRLIVAKK